MIDEFKKKIEDPSGPYQNGGPHKYPIKIRIITSSDSDNVGYGTEFLEILHEDNSKSHSAGTESLGNRPIVTPNSFDWKRFCVRDYWNHHSYWSSFEPLHNEALGAMRQGEGEERAEGVKLLRLVDGVSKNNLEALIATLEKGDADTRLETIKALRLLKGDAMSAIPLLRSELDKPATHTMAVEAALTLVTITPNETTLLVPKIQRLYEDAEIRDKLIAVKTMASMTRLPTSLIKNLVGDLVSFYIRENQLKGNKDPKFFDEQQILPELRKAIVNLLTYYPSVAVPELLGRYERGGMTDKNAMLEALEEIPNLPAKFVSHLPDHIEVMEDQSQRSPSKYSTEADSPYLASIHLYRIAQREADNFSKPAVAILRHKGEGLNSALARKRDEALKELFLNVEPSFQFMKTKELIEALPRNLFVIDLERALGGISDPGVVPYLIQKFKQSEGSHEKNMIYEGLKNRKDLPREARLEMLLEVAPGHVGRTGPLDSALKDLALPSDLPKIRFMARNEKYPTNVLAVLGQLGDESDVPFLVQIVKDKDKIFSRKNAVQGLASLGKKAKVAEPLLIEMLANEADFDVRTEAAYALASMLGRGAVKLIEPQRVAAASSNDIVKQAFAKRMAELLNSLRIEPK
jgi:hypothetical protein